MDASSMAKIIGGAGFRVVEGYPDYVVTDSGVVVSLNYGGTGKPKALKPRTVNGYLLVTLCRDGAKFQVSIHRLVAFAFLGKPPAGNVVNHINGDKRDNRLQNIEWATPSQNSLHAYRTGLHVISERHKAVAAALGRRKRKLTIEDAAAIRAAFLPGEVTQTELAARFGISRPSVGKILSNRTYVEVQA